MHQAAFCKGSGFHKKCKESIDRKGLKSRLYGCLEKPAVNSVSVSEWKNRKSAFATKKRPPKRVEAFLA